MCGFLFSHRGRKIFHTVFYLIHLRSHHYIQETSHNLSNMCTFLFGIVFSLKFAGKFCTCVFMLYSILVYTCVYLYIVVYTYA